MGKDKFFLKLTLFLFCFGISLFDFSFRSNAAFARDIIVPKIPVLLVHGYQPIPFDPVETWKGMAEVLSGSRVLPEKLRESPTGLWYLQRSPYDPQGRDVFISNYAIDNKVPTILSISLYAQRLQEEIDFIKKKEGVNNVDIVAHSMGGLIARRYVEAEDFHDIQMCYNGDIEKLIMIATPNHGVLMNISIYGVLPFDTNLMYTSIGEMAPGSPFLETLNAGVTTSQKHVECYTIAGEKDFLFNRISNTQSKNSYLLLDGVVLESSVKLSDAKENIVVKYLGHFELYKNFEVQEAVRNLLNGKSVPNPIIIAKQNNQLNFWFFIKTMFAKLIEYIETLFIKLSVRFS
jgi:hypothetical protein